MVQPVKKGVKQAYKRKTHTVNKSAPINTDRVGDRIDTKVKKKRIYQQKPQKKHPEYGTSKWYEEQIKENTKEKTILVHALCDVAKQQVVDYSLMEAIAEKIADKSSTIRWQNQQLQDLLSKQENRGE